MNELIKKVNWAKVAEKAVYAVTIITAVAGAISDNQKEAEFKQMRKDIERLKKGKS